MKQEHISEIKAIVILAIGLILLASLLSFVPEDLSWYTSHPNDPAKNLIRQTGAYMAGSMFFTLGYSAYAFVIFLFFLSWNTFAVRELEFSFSKLVGFAALIIVISSLLGMATFEDSAARFSRCGLVGLIFSDFLVNYLGKIGAYIVLLTSGVLALILTAEILVVPVFLGVMNRIQQLFEGLGVSSEDKPAKAKAVKKSLLPDIVPKINWGHKAAKKAEVEEEDEEEEYEEDEEDEEDEEEYDEDDEEYEEDEEDEEEYDEDDEEYDEDDEEELDEHGKPKIRITKQKKNKVSKRSKKIGKYKLPPLDLLEDSPELPTSQIENDLMNGSKMLESTLASFGVQAKVVDIERGPAITRYELQPALGVKVQKFTTLSDDIALVMKVAAVRIVAPIPGKSRVGIEVPNASSASVYLKDVLSSPEFQKSDSKLTMCLGKDIAGKPMIADLASMPHLLIAGTTGSGKTVCVNSIIMSMLYNASPDEVKFVMVDPKMVELMQYNEIPHLLCPTVTDAKKAAAVLNWVVSEMENRYKQLSKVGVRNIKAYNEKGNSMHYIVVIIDELADLMQVSAKGVEGSIARLAQLSRAVGIHLILATQRPSVNVITGVIKANFPARISFKVASKVDSRTVLDANGAESLLGRGDMLFIQPGDAKPTRGQGNFVKDEEIHDVIKFIKEQADPSYDESILTSQKPGPSGEIEEKDEYFDDAVKLIIETNQASVSILQRRMRLGYTRAARLIDMMEQSGIVGPYVGSKPREILVDREQWLLDNMSQTDE